MYVTMRDRLQENLSLPKDNLVLRQLSNTMFEYTKDGAKLKLIDKASMEESPNEADACALTFYDKVYIAEQPKRESKRHRDYQPARMNEKSWMVR